MHSHSATIRIYTILQLKASLNNPRINQLSKEGFSNARLVNINMDRKNRLCGIRTPPSINETRICGVALELRTFPRYLIACCRYRDVWTFELAQYTCSSTAYSPRAEVRLDILKLAHLYVLKEWKPKTKSAVKEPHIPERQINKLSQLIDDS
jgi:hypothetical protein